MCRFLLTNIFVFIATLCIIGCNHQANAAKVQEHSDETPYKSGELLWLHDIGICSDSLMSDTVPNPLHRKGVYLDSLQIHRLIADKIPNREDTSISSIRLFSIKKLSDSLFICFYVYEFSDIEDTYMFLYNEKGEATDALKLPLPSVSNIMDVVDGIEYIYYFESNVEFTDNNHFIVIENNSTKGWDIENNKCKFETSLVTETYYVISPNGKIHKEDVAKANDESLCINQDTKYDVYWPLSLIPVVQLDNAGTDLLIPFIGTDLIREGDSFPQSLIIECTKPTQELVERLKNYCATTSLPANYEWFYGFATDEKFVIGIKDTHDTFTAQVTEVSVYSNAYNEFKPTLSCLMESGEQDVNVDNLEQFTTKHIMRTVITEINGDFVGVFTNFSPIENGSLDINGLSTAKINYLFHNTPIIPVNKVVTK